VTGQAAFNLFSQPAGPDADVLAGLAVLEDGPPLWGDRLSWIELVTALRGFQDRWSAVAVSAAWSTMQLYSVDADAPRARLSRLGGAFLACSHNHRVTAVDHEAIRLVTRTSARLSIYRPEAGGVLAWQLRPSEPALERDRP
jgi:hypothetical protein